MRRVWLIRAGSDGGQIDAMRGAGEVALRFDALGNVRGMTHDDVEQAFIAAGFGTGSPALRAVLMQFATEIRVGDLVVSPYPLRHEIWVGVVSGGYEYSDEPTIAGYRHRRDVDWMGWLDRDAPWMKEQLKSLERDAVVFELASREWWWRQVDEREFASKPRPLSARMVRSATGTRRSPGATRERAPKAPAAPRRSTPTLVLCAGQCGLQWAAAALVDGLCPDCRAD